MLTRSLSRNCTAHFTIWKNIAAPMTCLHRFIDMQQYRHKSKRVKSPIIGIDLGTSFSRVALMEGKQPKVITNKGLKMTPSTVAVTKDGNLVGISAKGQAGKNISNTFYPTKRIIGKRYEDPYTNKDEKNCVKLFKNICQRRNY